MILQKSFQYADLLLKKHFNHNYYYRYLKKLSWYFFFKVQGQGSFICHIQHTVDLINNNINRDVQEECANRLYRVCTHSSNADDGE